MSKLLPVGLSVIFFSFWVKTLHCINLFNLEITGLDCILH